MKTGVYYLFTPDGEFKLAVTSTPIRVMDSVQQALLRDCTILVENALDFTAPTNGAFGPANLRCGSAATVIKWIVIVRSINLETNFVIRDGIHFPTFNPGLGELMTLTWRPPPTMDLRLAVDVVKDADGAFFTDTQYLCAFNAKKEAFRLPVGNLYTDCKLCHGMRSKHWETQEQAVLAALKHFQSSPWNSDLYSESREKETKRLFGWTPNENGFTQIELQVPDEWMECCEKVVHPNVQGWL